MSNKQFIIWLDKISTNEDETGKNAKKLYILIDNVHDENTKNGLTWSENTEKTAQVIADASQGKAVVEKNASEIKELIDTLYLEFKKPSDNHPSNLLEYLVLQEKKGETSAGELLTLIKESESISSSTINNTVDLTQIINLINRKKAGILNINARTRLQKAIIEYWADYFAVENGEGERNEKIRSDRELPMWPKWASYGAIIGATLLIIIVFVFDQERLKLLSDVSAARGFITFIFTVGTISLFLVITAATVFDSTSSHKDIYQRSKTILAMLIGIFGTVLGFYFGASDDSGAIGNMIEVGEIEFVKQKPDLVNGKFALKTSVSGGEKPYTFVMNIYDVDGKPLENTKQPFIQKSNGSFVKDLDLNAVASKKRSKVKFVVFAWDANNKKSKSKTMETSIGKEKQMTE